MGLSQPTIGGTVRSDSTSEAALRVALASSKRAGGRVELFAAADLVLAAASQPPLPLGT
jgi:FMN reductase